MPWPHPSRAKASLGGPRRSAYWDSLRVLQQPSWGSPGPDSGELLSSFRGIVEVADCALETPLGLSQSRGEGPGGPQQEEGETLVQTGFG